ncbi:hypothetical protein EMN47_05490 [Prolixibacteraceae bacterium JC049]|nr:hypothetical protein [Prolixibacteraceae bacterium JC049]
MNLKELLTDIRSGKEARLIADAAIDQPEYLEELWRLATSDWDKAWRAAWVIDHMHQKNSNAVKGIVDRLPEAVLAVKKDGVLRHFLKIISEFPIKENISGEFIDRCFDIFESTSMPIAVRVHAMQILFEFSKVYPDLQNELALLIEHHMEEGSAGMKSRGKKILAALNKL